MKPGAVPLNLTKEEKLDLIFHALADRTRRKILELSAVQSVSVGELVDQFDMSFPAVTKHLGVLEKAGLIDRTKQGRMRMCRMKIGPMSEVADLVVHYQGFWMQQLDQLDDYLTELQKKEE